MSELIAELSRGIMLEGASCAGKTSTMYAIKRLFAADMNLERNIIMLGEHYTQALNRIHGELKYHDREEHIQMLADRVTMLEQLHGWACSLGEARRTSRGLYTVLERCLLNHTAYYQDATDPRIIELAGRFSGLGITTVLLTVSEDQMEQRVLLREKQLNQNPTPSHLEKQLRQFRHHQNNMLDAIRQLPVPYRIINTDSMDWDGYAMQITAL